MRQTIFNRRSDRYWGFNCPWCGAEIMTTNRGSPPEHQIAGCIACHARFEVLPPGRYLKHQLESAKEVLQKQQDLVDRLEAAVKKEEEKGQTKCSIKSC